MRFANKLGHHLGSTFTKTDRHWTRPCWPCIAEIAGLDIYWDAYQRILRKVAEVIISCKETYNPVFHFG